jgi:hypothetical protein
VANPGVGSALVAKEFLKTTTWLSSRSTPEPVTDADIQKLAVLLTSTLIGLKNDTPAAITLRKHFRRGSTFIVSTGFPTFIRELLKVLFPTLRHRLFRNYQDAYNVTNFVWGDTRDRSIFLPRLTVSRSNDALITFKANEAWIEDREKDIRACDEWIIAIAMSQHPRLGRNSWLFRLDKELIIAIVKPLR